MSRKKSMKKKLAVAMSVVNMLNAMAPMALPYVNVSRNMSTAGGQTSNPGGIDISLSYKRGVAHAEGHSAGTLSSGTQAVSSGETGTVETMNGGTQEVNGEGTVTTMDGGVQYVQNGGKGKVETMNSGMQKVERGGTGTVDNMSGGVLNMCGGITSVTGRIQGGTICISALPASGSAVTAGSNISAGEVDISHLAIGTRTSATLLSAGGTIGDTNLVYDGGTAVLNASHLSQVVRAEQATLQSEDKGVNLTYNAAHIVSITEARKKLDYIVGSKVNSIAFGNMTWGVARAASGAGYDYTGAQVDASSLSFRNPEGIAAGGTTTLLEANNTLAAITETERNVSYSYAPVGGLTINGTIHGSYKSDANYNIVYTATANKANKLVFGNVAWNETTPFFDHSNTLTNVSFAAADVDTQNIHFTGVASLQQNMKMTLVNQFLTGSETYSGQIIGTKYTVGTTGEGTGTLSLDRNGNVIYTVNTSAGGKPIVTAQEQTHNTLMGMEAGMAVLAAGNSFIGKAAEGLGDKDNRGEDGISVFAAMGGGQSRYETGSHVKANTWGGIIAIGARNELSNGTLEWGGFVEHGSGNFTLYSSAGYGSGSSNYTGGGLLAKWQNTRDVYTEASLRMGRMHDTASDILRDAVGGSYGYNVHANYYGGHLGIGKIYRFNGGRSLDVYGKFFATKRNGVSFHAGGHYDLDAVNSDVLRIGARYSGTGARWNWYGGLAYEYEFDGEAAGTADGARIRSASIQGSSLFAELGLRMEATDTSPWKMDIGLTGHAGKHRGVGGNVSVAYLF